MTENDIMAELSYAYLHAVAARAGFGCKAGSRIDDGASVDAMVRVNEKMASDSWIWNFDIEVQLKATKQTLAESNGKYSYFFKGVDRYDRLRDPGSPLPKLLVVLILPSDSAQWLTLDENSLIARRCAYWVSLKGAPPSDNSTGQTIAIPRFQIFSVDGLRDVAYRLSRQEDLQMSLEPSTEFHLGITPSDVRWYALGRGWKPQPSRNPAVAIFYKPDSNVQLQVPQHGSGQDVALMMTEVLRKFSEIENRQIEDVSQDVRHPFADALRLRVKSRLADSGTLPLLEGLQLFEGGRKLLVSAACSTVMPQAFYPRKSLKGVDDFIKKLPSWSDRSWQLRRFHSLSGTCTSLTYATR